MTFPSRLQKYKKSLLAGFAILLLIVYGLALCVPYISSPKLWFISILGFLFPGLFLIPLSLSIILGILKSKWVLIPLVLLVLGVFAIAPTFPLNINKGSIPAKPIPGDIRIFSWNVSRWGIHDSDTVRAKKNRLLMLQNALSSNADLLCFNEFFEPRGNGLEYYKSNIDWFKNNGYMHFVFISASTIHTGTKEYGMAIFSKHPIINSQKFLFTNSEHSEGLLCADLFIDRKTVRVMITHLESFKSIFPGFHSRPKPSAMTAWAFYSDIMQAIYKKRIAQSGFVLDRIRESPFPLIICANLGDIPFSYTYSNFSDKLQDGFLATGNGFGKTFDSALPNLRFDYIFVSGVFRIKKFHISEKLLSDHYPLTMDISYLKYKE